MRARLYGLLIASCAALGGCVTTQEAQIAADDTRCQSYGVPKGSPAYVQCRAQLDQNRANVQAAGDLGNNGGVVGAIVRATR